MSPKAKKSMSDDHKAALAEGRTQSRAVRTYLEALEANKPKRGRKRTADSVKKRLDAIAQKLDQANPLDRLKLVQERKDLEAELAQMEQQIDLSALEAEFVKVAAVYGERQGIDYSSWREVGVPADVLKRAGVKRTRG